jgi:hypothetical protein
MTPWLFPDFAASAAATERKPAPALSLYVGLDFSVPMESQDGRNRQADREQHEHANHEPCRCVHGGVVPRRLLRQAGQDRDGDGAPANGMTLKPGPRFRCFGPKRPRLGFDHRRPSDPSVAGSVRARYRGTTGP